MTSQVVFTIAVGKPIYLRMACALARSFFRHNERAGIDFVIVSDRSVAERPADLTAVRWVEVPSGAYGRGFTPKLHLDKLAPAPRSLFIDADCLVVRSLQPAFDAFQGRPVGVLGRPISAGEWFGDTAAIIKKLGVTAMPRFNGGIYYLEPGPTCTAVYETARQLLPRYDELGFIRLRGSENDEVLMASALAIQAIAPLVEDGTIMHTAMEGPGGMDIDVLSGRATLHNPRDHPRHFDWMPLERMEPAIVHFLGADPADHPYRTEMRALELVANGSAPIVARMRANITSAWPKLATQALRNTFRPAYRAAFGVRPVRPTVR
jgi:hypothetical protein